VIPDAFHDFFVASAGVGGALVGLLFVAISVTQERLAKEGESQEHGARPRDTLFLVAQTVLFVIQLIAGISAVSGTVDVSSTRTIAILVIVSFLIGIARAWELIGGPEIGLFHELRLLGRDTEERPGPGADL
jgi:hypothetical protein